MADKRMKSQGPLLSVEGLAKHFKIGKNKILKAVDGVSFEIQRGETFGLVGESGCGKSTLGRTVVGLYERTRGSVSFDGIPLKNRMTSRDRDAFALRMQMIFQDPYTSLNPRMKVNDIIAEGIDNHRLAQNNTDRNRMVVDLLHSVGLDEEHGSRYPHEFSGGQRQRIGVARALAVSPEFIVADEPISALDVSIQAQVVNLLKSLQEERGLTYMFIAHDLSMVKHISDRIGVMYLGNLVEVTDSVTLFDDPIHPYTKALLSSIPLPDPKVERGRNRIVLGGSVKSPVNLPDNCRFCSRCSVAEQICKEKIPEYREVKPGHFVACHLA